MITQVTRIVLSSNMLFLGVPTPKRGRAIRATW